MDFIEKKYGAGRDFLNRPILKRGGVVFMDAGNENYTVYIQEMKQDLVGYIAIFDLKTHTLSLPL